MLPALCRCLQDKKYAKDFSKSCRDEVQSYENEISKDYRLNYRLRTACQKDIQDMCGSICTSNDGQASSVSRANRGT